MRKWIAGVSATALALCLATGAIAQQADGGDRAPANVIDYKTWDGYLGGVDSSQYSALDQINKSNVNQLELAWEFDVGPLRGGHYGFRYNPTIVDGVMYVVAPNAPDALIALDGATGKEIWRTTFEGRIGNRGVSYWESKDRKERRLFVLNNGRLRAVDATTGQIIPGFGPEGGIDLRDALSREDRDKVRPLQHDNPGRVFEDSIIIALPAGNYDYNSSPADIHSYDVRTGKLNWVFHMVPEKGEFGYETWPEKDHEKFGGSHNWSSFTVDPELGMIYIPTGAPRFDWYGGNREGDNLFANSIVALNARTGERVWHFQAVHHDLWDYDLPTSPKLLTLRRDGQEIPVVIQPTKMGWLLVFDRRTGEPIWPIPEVPVPTSTTPGEKASPTQPIPSWPPHYARQRFTEEDINPYLNDEDKAKVRELLRTARNEGLFTPVSTQGTILMPSENGGANFGMVSVDPVRNRLFIVVRNYPSFVRHIPNNNAAAKEAMPNSDLENVQPYASPFDFMIQSNGMVPISPPWSTITAYDMNSGNMLYQIPNGDEMQLAAKGITGTGSQATRGGPTVTAADLLFVPTPGDRKLRARDASTGQTLWEYDLPAAGEGTPAVYEADGRQFVVIPVGWEGQFHQGMDTPPVPETMRYMAFALPKAAN
ncbi:MAG TPA: PQQ-binding-like beta-propeller repeat protein [Croceibacterium sp.]|nr:PQQ-binding-like beta-propeller repeat protein [Croceibacterium sp.]